MENESFVFYRSFHEALQDLDDADYGMVLRAINEYALNGTEPELTGAAKIAYKLIKPQLDANARRKTNGSKGGRPKNTTLNMEENQWLTEEKPLVNKIENQWLTEEKPNVNVNANVNVKVNDNEKVNDKRESAPAQQEAQPATKKRFIKPTLEEIQEYCSTRNNGINAQHFLDFYESKGWKIGSQSMKDWKAAIRTWEARNRGATDMKRPEFPPERLEL